MATQTIFDELIGSGIELNMLETRENIIRHFAHHCIITEVTHKIDWFLNNRLWDCYEKLFEHVFKGKKLDIKALFDRTKKILTGYPKLEDLFDRNIYLWHDIKNLTKNIESGTELFIPTHIIYMMDRLDKKYDDFVEKVCVVLDKYSSNSSLNCDQLIEIKTVFEQSRVDLSAFPISFRLRPKNIN